jgi:hypothetical protein
MPSFDHLQALALIVGVFLQVLGLGFVIYQLKRVNTSIRVSAQSALYQQSATIRQLLVEHPDVRKYLFDGEPADRELEDYARIRTVAEMALNYLEHLVIQEDSLRAHDQAAWKRFVVGAISKSPIMQEIIEQSPDSYSPDLVAVYRSSTMARP